MAEMHSRRTSSQQKLVEAVRLVRAQSSANGGLEKWEMQSSISTVPAKRWKTPFERALERVRLSPRQPLFHLERVCVRSTSSDTPAK